MGNGVPANKVVVSSNNLASNSGEFSSNLTIPTTNKSNRHTKAPQEVTKLQTTFNNNQVLVQELVPALEPGLVQALGLGEAKVPQRSAATRASRCWNVDSNDLLARRYPISI
mmetsp:Transcript_6875/g.14004  ORF Transcript_6875/g.14004 Transcript_6875/m.14004 type:complete len:112 (+) Transcript_6875:1201-1536(+)